MASETKKTKRVITYSRSTTVSKRRRTFDENAGPTSSAIESSSSTTVEYRSSQTTTTSIDIISTTTTALTIPLSSSPTEPPPKKSFSFFTRRLPLTTLPSSTRKATSNAGALPAQLAAPSKPLTQMQIDLDGFGAPRITCKECGMPYTPSSAEDSKIHKKFHEKHVDGIDYSLHTPLEFRTWDGITSTTNTPAAVKIELNSVKDVNVIMEQPKKIQSKLFQAPPNKTTIRKKKEKLREGHIVTIHYRSPQAEKRKALEILAFVNNELSATDLPESEIWSSTIAPENEPAVIIKEEHQPSKPMQSKIKTEPALATKHNIDKFKILLYIIGKKCVGLCLAERISRAFETAHSTSGNEDTPHAHSSSSISVSTTSHPAVLGVSRIWTCASYRRMGVASQLVKTASETFIYGMKIRPEMVAFSQPTETGGLFAKEWSRSGGIVGVDDVSQVEGVLESGAMRKELPLRLLVYTE